MESALPVTTIECPYCSEPVNAKSKKCRHCGEMIDPQMREMELLKSQRQQSVFMNAGGAAASSSSERSLRRFPHWFHLILVVFTGLLWLPGYILMYLFRNKRYYC